MILTMDELADELYVSFLTRYQEEGSDRHSRFLEIEDFFLKAFVQQKPCTKLPSESARKDIVVSWMPSYLRLTTLLFLRADIEKSACDLGFGDGRNLLVWNGLLDIDRVYAYDTNPYWNRWVKNNLVGMLRGGTMVYYQIPDSLNKTPAVCLANEDFRKATFPKDCKFYFCWPNEAVLPIIIEQIPPGSQISLYYTDGQELGDRIAKLPLTHTDSVVCDDQHIDLFKKSAQH